MEEETEPVLYRRLCAPNDVNGNPRRVYAVYGAGGRLVDVIDEGYDGRPAHLRDVPDLPPVAIPGAEYRVWMRRGDALHGRFAVTSPAEPARAETSTCPGRGALPAVTWIRFDTLKRAQAYVRAHSAADRDTVFVIVDRERQT